MKRSFHFSLLLIIVHLSSCYHNAPCNIELNLADHGIDTTQLLKKHFFIHKHDTIVSEIIRFDYFQVDTLGFDISLNNQAHCTVGFMYAQQFKYMGELMEEVCIELWSNEKLKPEIWNGPDFKYRAFSWSKIRNVDKNFEIDYDVNFMYQVDTVIEASHNESYFQEITFLEGEITAFKDEFNNTWTKN